MYYVKLKTALVCRKAESQPNKALLILHHGVPQPNWKETVLAERKSISDKSDLYGKIQLFAPQILPNGSTTEGWQTTESPPCSYSRCLFIVGGPARGESLNSTVFKLTCWCQQGVTSYTETLLSLDKDFTAVNKYFKLSCWNIRRECSPAFIKTFNSRNVSIKRCHLQHFCWVSLLHSWLMLANTTTTLQVSPIKFTEATSQNISLTLLKHDLCLFMIILLNLLLMALT